MKRLLAIPVLILTVTLTTSYKEPPTPSVFFKHDSELHEIRSNLREAERNLKETSKILEKGQRNKK